MDLRTTQIEEVVLVRDTPVPARVRFRQILVTGVPGSGKGTLVSRIGGWPEEGVIDLGRDGWWKSQMLTLRPREVHLLLPVAGRDESLAVTDAEWLAELPATALERIRIPPPKRGWFSTDWRGRFAFDFQLPPPETIFEARQRRQRAGTHPVDRDVTLEQVRSQLDAYREVALHLHREGITVYVREDFLGMPRSIVQDTRGDAKSEG